MRVVKLQLLFLAYMADQRSDAIDVVYELCATECCLCSVNLFITLFDAHIA
jgi:hypothetical protein